MWQYSSSYPSPYPYWPHRGEQLRSYIKPLAPQIINIKNLTIEDAKASDGNLDYIRFDPESDDADVAAPKISFRIEDGEIRPDDRYDWKVMLRETSKTTNISDLILEGSITSLNNQSSIVTASIPESLPRGVYGFDIRVGKFGTYIYSPEGYVEDTEARQDWIDGVSLRSNHSFLQTSLQIADEEPESLKFHYRITPIGGGLSDYEHLYKPLSSVKIEAVDAAFNRAPNTVDGPTALNIEHSVTAPEPESEEAGEGRVIATGVDDLGKWYRDHKPKRLWPKSASKSQAQIDLSIETTDEATEDSEGGWVIVNEGYEEENADSEGVPIWDSYKSDRIDPNDESLRNGSIEMKGVVGSQGKWKLTFPETVQIWKNDGQNHSRIASGTEYPVTLPKKITLKIEGIQKSAQEKDTLVEFSFSSPSSAKQFDAVLLTVYQSQVSSQVVAGTHP